MRGTTHTFILIPHVELRFGYEAADSSTDLIIE